MATGISTLLLIVSAFVTNSISFPCKYYRKNDTDNTYRCVLSDKYAQDCCSSGDDCVLTKFIHAEEEPELNATEEWVNVSVNITVLNITELILEHLTLENCVKPLVIEHIRILNITNVTFR